MSRPVRTSLSHPLQIATVAAGPGLGAVGVTLCPGKKDPHGLTAAWSRDLDTDLDALEQWGTAAIVTLMEDHELAALQVPRLGPAIHARQLAWYHLPIVDVSVPGPEFGPAWALARPHLHDLLRSGCNVLLHCRGGLGRSGMIAAQLLAELGWEPARAIAAIRKARPGAIETRAQEAQVRDTVPIAVPPPSTAPDAVADRALGAMLGLAIGDAVGTTLEFKPRGSFKPIADMLGGGPFKLKPGQWTDDTAMALALAESLIAKDGLDPKDLMERFLDWHQTGAYSCTGTCFDIGITTRQALQRYRTTGNPIAGSTAPDTAGNGSLMRLAPVAIHARGDKTKAIDLARLQSSTTHGAPEARDACAAFAELLVDAIAGMPKPQLLSPRTGPWGPKVAAIMAGSWRSKPRGAIASTGYALHSLEAALWCTARAASFKDAILAAANLGHDADTTAAITGQIAGAIHGASAIPQPWCHQLAWAEKIGAVCARLSGAS
ncbi:MAG: ADP-ribosylglycohydrolase family protein [Candidatus Sericytochromatia bacterium]|nr:ADP-ribosylglycohydrolase family protein [Candidatus Tanganyikabacteria bacterium]